MDRRTDFIIPECYVDTNLVETLVRSAGCNHQKGCNQVAKVMQVKFTDRFAIGIIDDDKRHPSYLCEFVELISNKHLKLFRHPQRPHFMIVVHPAIDGFILSCAEAAEVDIREFSLSPVLKEFTAQTKNVMSNKDIRFKQLFNALQDVGELKILKDVLNYLIFTTYNAKNEELTALFLKA